MSKVGPSFRIAGRADHNRARLTYVVRRGGPTAFPELPPRAAPPSFITFKGMPRRVRSHACYATLPSAKRTVTNRCYNAMRKRARLNETCQLDPSRKVSVRPDGGELAYDLFLAVPLHRAPTGVVESPGRGKAAGHSDAQPAPETRAEVRRAYGSRPSFARAIAQL